MNIKSCVILLLLVLSGFFGVGQVSNQSILGLLRQSEKTAKIDINDAIKLANQAINLADSLQHYDSLKVAYIHTSTLYSRPSKIKNNSKVKQYIYKAVEIPLQNTFEDSVLSQYVYSQIAGQYMSFSQNDSAFLYINKAEGLLVQNITKNKNGLSERTINQIIIDQTTCIILKGDVYKSIMDYEYALVYYKKAYNIIKSHENMLNSQLESILLSRMSSTYSVLGNHEMILKYQKRGTQISLLNNNIAEYAVGLSNIGIAYEETNLDSSFFYFNKSIKSLLKIIPSTHSFMGKVYSDLGRVMMRKGFVDSVAFIADNTRIEELHRIASATGNFENKVEFEIEYALRLHQYGKVDSLLKEIVEKVDIIDEKKMSFKDITAYESFLIYEARLAEAKMSKKFREGFLEKRIKNKLKVLSFFSNVRAKLSSQMGVEQYYSNQLNKYRDVVTTISEYDKLSSYAAEIIGFGNQLRSYNLLANTDKKALRQNSELTNTLNDLSDSLIIIEKQLSEISSKDDSVSNLLNEIKSNINLQIVEKQRQLNLNLTNDKINQPINLEEFKKLSKSRNECFVQFLDTEKFILAFSISGEGTRIFTIEREEKLLNTIRNLQAQLNGSASLSENYSQTALELSRMLKLDSLLNPTNENICLVTNGVLGNVPFDILPTELDGKQEMLIEKYNIRISQHIHAGSFGEKPTG